MSILFLLAIVLPTTWATEESILDEPVYTDFDRVRVGRTRHNAHVPKDAAMRKFLDMSGAFFAARDEPNSLDEAKLKVVDELFDAFDLDGDHLWSEAEFSEYFVKSSRLEGVWEQLAGENDVVERSAMEKYLARVFASGAATKISAFVAVTQGLALTSPTMKAYLSEMADSFEYPVTWEAFKTSQAHAAWVNLPGAKYDGLASEESMVGFFYGATKDIATRIETIETSTIASDYETVGDLIEELSGVAERRRLVSLGEAIVDGSMCMLGAFGDVFFGPLSTVMSMIGCIDLIMNAQGECGYDSAFISGNGALSCLASFVPGVGLASNIDCVVSNVNAIIAIGKSTPPSCKWFGSAPDCGYPYHQCSGDFPQWRAFDTCGDGNRCQRGQKVHCCEKFTHYRAPSPTVEPAMRLYNDEGKSKPICSPRCDMKSGVCYKCTNGVSCDDCWRLRGATDCRSEYCIHLEERCTNWKHKHACVGSIIDDLNLSQTECVRECRQNKSCNCVTWGVNSSKKCRLETGTYSTNRNVDRYWAVSMKECFYG